MHPLGGLARQATLVDRARAEADAVLVVDAGDVFLPPALRLPNYLPPDESEVERRARLIAGGLARLGLGAMTLGERDLAIGPAALRRLIKDFKLPVVSANIVDRSGKRVFPATRLLAVDGPGGKLEVGVFAVTRALPDDAELWKAAGYDATPPEAAAAAAIAELRAAGADTVVGLLHVGNVTETKKFVAEVKGIDWAVLGHSAMSYDPPELVGATHLLEAFTMGKNVGRVDLHLLDGKPSFADRGRRSQLITIRTDHQHQLEDLAKRSNDDKAGKLREYFDRRSKELVGAIATESAQIDALPAHVAGSWWEGRTLPLDTSIPDQPGVAILVGAYNEENRRRGEAGKPVGIGVRMVPPPGSKDGKPVAVPAAHPAAAPPAEGPLRYAGVASCIDCHPTQHKVWLASKHAHALDALKKVKRDHDPTCVGCHVTGFLRPGGTRDLALATARLRDVGCEACHGPGADHVIAQGQKTTIARKVDEAVCLGCHTPDQTQGDFEYASYLKAIIGPGHGG